MSLVLALDIGTTNLKAAVVNERGEVLALSRKPIPVLRPEPDAAEHDPEQLYALFIAAAREVSQDYVQQIDSLVFSTYQLGMLLLDESLRPLSGMTLLSDQRARASFAEFRQSINWRELYQRSGCPPMIQYPLARLFNFKQRKPELLSSARWVLGCKDYLLLRLSGEIITEPSTAAATQMFNLRSGKWDEQALKLVGLDETVLATVVDGLNTSLDLCSAAKEAIGLKAARVQIFPGVYDGGALALGLSGLKQGVGIMNVGTTAMLRVPGMQPCFDNSEHLLLQPYCLSPGIYFNGGAVNNGTLVINWLQEKIAELDLDAVPEFGALSGPPPFCLPYLTGERDSKIGAVASGVFFGLRDTHSKQDLLRSVMEGVAFSLCLIKEALLNQGAELSELRMGGGGAGSKEWSSIIADVLNLPVSIPQGAELALVGNAVIAYTAKGLYSSLEEADKAMTSNESTLAGEVVLPQAERVVKYAAYFQFFKDLRNTAGELFEKHRALAL